MDQNNNTQTVWELFLQDSVGRISGHVLETWFYPIHYQKVLDATIFLEVRDQFSRDWLTDHYLDFIRTGLKPHVGEDVAIEWIINPDLKKQEPAVEVSEEPAPTNAAAPISNWSTPQFNKRYTFNNFVCGPSNQFAVAAARAVAEKPGKAPKKATSKKKSSSKQSETKEPSHTEASAS